MQVRLTPEGCQKRQVRFLQYLAENHFDLAIISDWRDIYYFVGVIGGRAYPRILVVESGGSTTLIVEGKYPEAVTDRQLVYPLQTMATLNFEPNAEVTALLKKNLPPADRIAVQQESLLASTAQAIRDQGNPELVPIDDALLRMQALKDEDEIAVLGRANELNDIGYAAVSRTIREGVTEAEVLAAGKAAVVGAAGCHCDYNGDFRCASPGGFATDRPCRAGELYVIDAGLLYQGYWSDNCRTFPVTTLNDRQRRAWEMTEQTVLMAEKMVKPGTSCRSVFEAMKEMQEKIKPGALFHHGGHGTGLRPHTYPRINPHFDDVFETGNVITLEPGVYGEDLGGGVRLEHNYLVTAEGVERLTQFPISVPER